MKQIYMQSKTPGYIKDVYTENNQVNFNPKTNRMKSSIASKGDEGKREAIERMKNLNIFLIQNKGKGPPGRSRSPGAESYPEHPPDGEADQDASPSLPKAKNTFWQRSLSFGYLSLSKMSKGWSLSLSKERPLSLSKGNTEQTFYNTQIPNYYSQFNFTNMKKQILIFVFLALAVFAGVNKSYGQAVHLSDPLGMLCKDDALHPLAGKEYGYTIDVNPTLGTYYWWATKDEKFISAPGTTNSSTMLTTPVNLLTASSQYGASTTGATGATVSITWSDKILSTTKYKATPSATPTIANPSPTFVAVHYNAPSGVGNCADNIKVFELDPVVAFTVDIKNIDDATFATQAYGATVSQCVADVASATYTAGAMVYDYGVDYMYFEVVAANFTGSWTPTFTVTQKQTDQVISSIDFTYALPSTWGTPPTWINWTAGTGVTTNETNTAQGVSIFVRVTIQNKVFENEKDAHPNGQNITLAVDGQNSVGIWDIVNDPATCTLASAADQNDKATQTLYPRPALREAAPSTTSTITTNTKIIPGNNVP